MIAEYVTQTIKRLKGKVARVFITHQVPKGLQVDAVVNRGRQGNDCRKRWFVPVFLLFSFAKFVAMLAVEGAFRVYTALNGLVRTCQAGGLGGQFKGAIS